MFMVSAAQATLTVSVVRLPIAAAAKTADPNLNGARSYDLRVTQSGGERWNVTTMQFSLGTGGNLSGTLYQSPGALTQNGANVFQTSFTPNDPQYYDTSWNVSMNDSARTTILGNSDYPNTAGAGSVASQTSTSASVAWGDVNGNTNTTGDGSFSIGRITIKGNTGAYLNGYVAGNINLNNAQIFHNVYIPILGDINGDGVVNQTDLNVVTQNFLSTTAPQADFNDDGVVNQTDLNAITQDFLNNLAAPPGAALGSLVPEPTSMALLAGASLMLVKRRRQG
jgi:hypothetical protein